MCLICYDKVEGLNFILLVVHITHSNINNLNALPLRTDVMHNSV